MTEHATSQEADYGLNEILDDLADMNEHWTPETPGADEAYLGSMSEPFHCAG